MTETIHNLCSTDIVLRRAGYPSVRFPGKAEGPTASCLAARLPRRDSLISDVQWSTHREDVLPPVQEGVFYIVSEEFAHICQRRDLLIAFRSWDVIERDAQGGLLTCEIHTEALVPVHQAFPPEPKITMKQVEAVRGQIPFAGIWTIKLALVFSRCDVEQAVAWMRANERY